MSETRRLAAGNRGAAAGRCRDRHRWRCRSSSP